MRCVARIKDPEGELLNILNDRGTLEWRKYRQRYPKTWTGTQFERTGHSKLSPYIGFRFEREDQEFILSLSHAVSSYKGWTAWCLDGRKRLVCPGTNWIVAPARVKELEPKAGHLGISAEDYIARFEPDFTRSAFDDLLLLTEHVRRSL